MLCPKCGKEIEQEDSSCKYCGEEIVIENEEFKTKEHVKNTDILTPTLALKKNPSIVYEEPAEDVKNKKGIKAEVPPLSFIHSLFMMLIIVIPIVNIIMLLVWSFKQNVNINKRNISRAIVFLCIFFYAAFALMDFDIFSSVSSL